MSELDWFWFFVSLTGAIISVGVIVTGLLGVW